MSLNIKDPETHKLAQELARETGQSMARAVKQAIRDHLNSVRRQNGRRSRKNEILKIGRDCAKLLHGKPIDHDKLLYDGKGLPR